MSVKADKQLVEKLHYLATCNIYFDFIVFTTRYYNRVFQDYINLMIKDDVLGLLADLSNPLTSLTQQGLSYARALIITLLVCLKTGRS